MKKFTWTALLFYLKNGLTKGFINQVKPQKTKEKYYVSKCRNDVLHKKIWLLAKLPEKYTIGGEQIEPYLVFSNSHDGSGAIKVAMTPVRVVCQNTLNLALSTAKRVWSTAHVGESSEKMYEARNTLLLAEKYMGELEDEFSRLSRVKLSDSKVMEYIEMLLPMDEHPN